VNVEINSIQPLDKQRYDVAFTVDGAPLRIVCGVASHRGRPYAQPEPDVFMTGRVPARDVVAAVRRYHRDRTGGF
jgi:hypothetical protein